MEVAEYLFRQLWVKETSDLCRIATYRNDGISSHNILKVREYLKVKAENFNATQTDTKLQQFAWAKKGDTSTSFPTDDQIIDSDYWVFGYRLGSKNPKYKVAIICHLDTVPAETSDVWRPFEPAEEVREYPTGTISPQSFLVGRGTIDDKGPAVSAFIVARAIAKKFDSSQLLKDVQVEISFDSSEETDMSTPHYLEDELTNVPDFGIVYDAFWNTRAEKGIERPTFTVAAPSFPPPTNELYLHKLLSAPNNSTNTVPDWVEAAIRGPEHMLISFSESVDDLYSSFQFDDNNYRRAEMTAYISNGSLILRTIVAGAQHGSAPQENRSEGANPLVSITNFLAGLSYDGSLSNYGAPIAVCNFIAQTFGTYVFGELHESLYAYDEVFTEGNGTTYAVTKTRMIGADHDIALGIELDVDIRYAIPHHETAWDGVTEGFLDGDKSRFDFAFATVVNYFNTTNQVLLDVAFYSKTKCGPDIRTPDNNPNYLMVERAYREVRGVSPPRAAIGGGTDAKGYTFLLAAGALFSNAMGPPINYHGINEAAPIADLNLSTKILYRVIEMQIQNPSINDGSLASMEINHKRKSIQRVQQMRQNTGFKHKCEHCA